MSNGRIHFTFSPESVSEILELLGQIEGRLPFLQIMKPSEKARLVKPRPGTPQVIRDIADLQGDAGIPAGADDPMLADLSVYEGLTQIEDRLSHLLRRIADTRLLAGSEGWSASLIRYGMLRKLERSNPALKTRLDRLQRLIASHTGRSTPVEGEPEVPEIVDEDPAE